MAEALPHWTRGGNFSEFGDKAAPQALRAPPEQFIESMFHPGHSRSSGAVVDVTLLLHRRYVKLPIIGLSFTPAMHINSNGCKDFY